MVRNCPTVGVILSLLLGLCCLSARAQTYSVLSLTNFVLSAGKYVASTNISVPANTVFQTAGFFYSTNVTLSSASVQYGAGPVIYPSGLTNGSADSVNAIGPCSVTITAVATNNLSPAAYLSVESAPPTNFYYSQLSLTNFLLNAGVYTATTNITVPTNMVLRLVAAGLYTTDINGFSETIQYANGPVTYPSGATHNWVAGSSILGPCTVQLSATSADNLNPTIYTILTLQAAN